MCMNTLKIGDTVTLTNFANCKTLFDVAELVGFYDGKKKIDKPVKDEYVKDFKMKFKVLNYDDNIVRTIILHKSEFTTNLNIMMMPIITENGINKEVRVLCRSTKGRIPKGVAKIKQN